jgi:lipopolysaccharide/colanic/teichoic acid biosynthesis glycosyltransferase
VGDANVNALANDDAPLLVGTAPERALDSHATSAVSPQERATLRYHSSWRHAKRGLDLFLVVISLPVTLIAMAVIATVVKLGSPGPVLYKQRRLGQGGAEITVLKFRTMAVGSSEQLRADSDLSRRYLENDYKLPVDEDPRIVRGGRFLRRCSLDELPQLFNVLGGSMSLVGPRPILAEELTCYGAWASAYLESKPGITGRWQTDGRCTVRYPERAKMDADYLQNWTLAGDLGILLKTIPAVVRRNGAH